MDDFDENGVYIGPGQGADTDGADAGANTPPAPPASNPLPADMPPAAAVHAIGPASPVPAPVHRSSRITRPTQFSSTNSSSTSASSSSSPPNTTSSSGLVQPRRRATPAATPRLERLYSSHKLTQEKLKKKREDALRAPPGCTFSPKIEASQRSQRRGQSGGSGSEKNKSASDSGGSRFNRLYATHQATQRKIEAMRQARQDEECTFKPKINKRRSKRSPTKSSSLGGLGASPGVGSRHDLLYATHSKYQAKKDAARATLGMEECTFSPKTNTSRQPKHRNKLYNRERIMQSMSEREARKRELEVEGCTFAPRINSRSEHRQGSDMDASERLYKQAEERRQRRLKAEIDAAHKEEEACSFKPQTSSPPLNRNASGGADSAFDRLYDNAQQRRESREAASQQQEFAFQPEINERSRELARHSDDRSLHEYLYKEGLAKTLQRQSMGDYRTTMRHRLEEEELEHCTFDPVVWKGRRKEMQHANRNKQKRIDALATQDEKEGVLLPDPEEDNYGQGEGDIGAAGDGSGGMIGAGNENKDLMPTAEATAPASLSVSVEAAPEALPGAAPQLDGGEFYQNEGEVDDDYDEDEMY